MKKVVFSCQNNQELADLVLIAKELKLNHDYSPIFLNMDALTGQQLDASLLDVFDVKYDAFNIFKKSIGELGFLGKFILSLSNAIRLLVILHKEKICLCVIGVPLLVYRLLSFLSLGKIKTASYVRSIIVQSEKSTSLSSRLFLNFKFLTRSRLLRRVISDYYSDAVICIGNVTASFLETRMVPKENIYTIGSVFCDEVLASTKKKKKEKDKRKKIVFLSSAFSTHGYDDCQIKQNELIIEIYNYIKTIGLDNCLFVVKKHPRESVDEYESFKALGGHVDNNDFDVLASNDKSTLYISLVSTLLFELAYLGNPILLVSNEHFCERFRGWYEALTIKPNKSWKKDIQDFIVNDYMDDSKINIKSIIDDKNEGRVVAEIAKVVDGLC